ncbi:MAG: heparinase II/III family protein [Bacteroidales bacterium]
MRKLILTYHTLKHLRPIQVRYQLLYRIKKVWEAVVGSKFTMFIPAEIFPLTLSQWIDKPQSLDASTFTFLNQSEEYPVAIDWNERRNGKLWAYNLNYMDYLVQEDMSFEQGIELLWSFVENQSSNNVGYEPYPIALRGINWIKFLSKHNAQYGDNKAITNSLYSQYLILEDNLEYHLMGNHLLENAFSLLFGAFYFNDVLMFSVSEGLLKSELKEQVLNDGAHFELSPMYHQIILDRLLDCINLLQNNQRFDNQKLLLDLLLGVSAKMLRWLNAMTFSDGSIPLFNDSTRGIAPATMQLNEYAKRLGLLDVPTHNKYKLDDSGYRRFESCDYELFVDVGAVGPDYIPGHAHADTFNFHLRANNKDIIVDTGISTYNKNACRQKERSTSAHNTVQYGNYEQSEVWGGFRVARRAKIISLLENGNRITAVHDAYKRFGVWHERSFNCSSHDIVIVDTMRGAISEECTARFHLAPNQKPRISNNIITLEDAQILFLGASSINIVTYYCALEFNLIQTSECLEIKFQRQLTTKIKINAHTISY